MIEAIKRGIPAKEVPVTVERRLHGHSKKPAVVRYGARLRQRDRPHLAALTSRRASASPAGGSCHGRCIPIFRADGVVLGWVPPPCHPPE